jgi:hypothetical protein
VYWWSGSRALRKARCSDALAPCTPSHFVVAIACAAILCTLRVQPRAIFRAHTLASLLFLFLPARVGERVGHAVGCSRLERRECASRRPPGAQQKLWRRPMPPIESLPHSRRYWDQYKHEVRHSASACAFLPAGNSLLLARGEPDASFPCCCMFIGPAAQT